MTIYQRTTKIPHSGDDEYGTALNVNVAFELGELRRFTVITYRPLFQFDTVNQGPRFDTDAQVLEVARTVRNLLDELLREESYVSQAQQEAKAPASPDGEAEGSRP